MRVSVIVAAGGLSTRFYQSLTPGNLPARPLSKLLFTLQGQPLICRSIGVFEKFSEVKEILLTVPRSSIREMKKLIKDQAWRKTRCVAGGSTRADSVLQGLKHTNSKNDWVLVHDGARPLITETAVRKLLQASKTAEAAILGRKVVPTIKKISSGNWISRTIDRSELFEAETPQMTRRGLLMRAYQKHPKALEATDEASLLEFLGIPVKVVETGSWNPKVTTADDLELVRAKIEGPNRLTRTGIGKDLHRLVPGRKFCLGGIRIPFHKGPLGHSDGDALLHAVTDAILGAIGKGDIGEWFSDKNPKHKNIASAKMLTAVWKEACRQGWSVSHVDSIVHLEQPKLKDYKLKMRKKIAQILDIHPDRVSVKAKTGEGLGRIGRNEAVACDALVTLQRSFS